MSNKSKKVSSEFRTQTNFLNYLEQNLGVDIGDTSYGQDNSDRTEYGTGMSDADIQAFYANEIAAQNQRNYETEMSNTSWQRGVADMQAAGLNPALAYGQGGAATPSGAAGSASATQFNGLQTILGFVGDIVGKLTDMAEGTMSMFKQSAEIRNLNAQNENLRTQNIVLGEQARNFGAEATAREIENQFKREQEEQKVRNLSLTGDTLVAQRDDIIAAMNLKVKQADTEVARRSVEIWKAAVERANASQIEALTPELVKYQQAATKNQQAQAALAATDEAYKQGLIDSGQIDSIIRELETKIQSNKSASDYQKASAALAEWKLAVREGHAFPNNPDWDNMIWQEYPAESCMWLLRGAANKFLQGVSALTDAIGGKPSVK